MRFAVVSDIHANLQAWKAVLLDIRSQAIEKIICLGDIVGYGPNPAQVLESVHANVDHLVLGNHDAVLCGKLDAELFNDRARTIIEWTADRLNDKAIAFLCGLPLSLRATGFRCVHADFSAPGAFAYIIEPEDALPSWQSVEEPMLFVGHTHRPGIFVIGSSGAPHWVEARDFEMEDGKRYIVNTGSVGQPRDGDARSSYCVYDTPLHTVCWRRVPFDLDAYRAAVEEAGIDSSASFFLQRDPRTGTAPLRDLLSFSPPTRQDQSARDTVAVGDIGTLEQRVRRWKTVTTAVVAAALLAGAAATAFVWRYAGRAQTLLPAIMEDIDSNAFGAEENMLPHPTVTVPRGMPVPGWAVQLGNRYRQDLAVTIDADGPIFVLSSDTIKDPLRLSSAPIRVTPGMRMTCEVLARQEEGFQGTLALVISLTRRRDGKQERIDQYVVKEPNVSRRGGWLQAKNTFDIPAGGEDVEFQIRGKFAGRVSLRDAKLYAKQ